MKDTHSAGDKIRVLVVDDSALMRKLIPTLLARDPEIEVVATAMDGIFALKKIREIRPDVITLDLDMPRMNGLALLPQITRDFQIPVLVVSSLTACGAEMTFRALELGAVDFITKPQDAVSVHIEQVGEDLVGKVKTISRIPRNRIRPAVDRLPTSSKEQETEFKHGETDRIVAIGVSTGGPIALGCILPRLQKDFPAGLVIVQHMPRDFTRMFAHRLNQLCCVEVKEAENGDLVRPGRVLIAPGDAHLKVKRVTTGCIAVVGSGPLVCGHRPSADVLFESVAEEFGPNAVGVIMTGMGEDGARGIGAIRANGGLTIAQDQETCVVFGMPKMAIKYGHIDRVVPLDKIIPTLVSTAGHPSRRMEEAPIGTDGQGPGKQAGFQGGVQ